MKGIKIEGLVTMVSRIEELKYPKSKLIDLPCGKCPGCRLAQNREKAVRAVLESCCWSSNWFVTLTYDDLHLPVSVSDLTGEILHPLVRKDMQDFMKLLRIRFLREHGEDGIRAFYSGEYGDRFGRPHFHLLLFNCNLRDLEYFARSDSGDFYFLSSELAEIWQNGQVIVGELTAASAAYTASYVQKKIDNNLSPGLPPVFSQGPTRPGLGAIWFDQHLEVLDSDQIMLSDGKIEKVPGYFIDRAKSFGCDVEILKKKRAEIAKILERQRIRLVSVDRFQILEEAEQDYFFRKKIKNLAKRA